MDVVERLKCLLIDMYTRTDDTSDDPITIEDAIKEIEKLRSELDWYMQRED